MSDARAWYRWDGPDLVLNVRLKPRARRQRVDGVRSGEMCISVDAPPVDGKANAALIGFLARAFDVPRAAVTLKAGNTTRHKRLRIATPACVPDWFATSAGASPAQ